MSQLVSYKQRYDEALNHIADKSSFKDFLDFTIKLNEMSFNDALMLFYYDPSIEMAAAPDEWKVLGRRVKRDANGIPVIREDGKGVFLFSDKDTVGAPLPERPILDVNDLYNINRMLRVRYETKFVSIEEALNQLASDYFDKHSDKLNELCSNYDEETKDSIAYTYKSCLRYAASVRCEYGKNDSSFAMAKELYIDNRIFSDTVFFKNFCALLQDGTHEMLNDFEKTVTDYLNKKNNNENKCKYQIYQLKSGDEYRGIRFMSMETIKRDGIQLSQNDYRLVYEGEIREFEGNATLEALYKKFNTDRPDDFKGHSLSISDVIAVSVDGKDTAYYCDSFGFKEMPEFFREKELVQDESETAKVAEPDSKMLLAQVFPDMFGGELVNAYEIYDDVNGKRTELRFLTHGRDFTAAEILTDDHEPIRFALDSLEEMSDEDAKYLNELLRSFDHSKNTLVDSMTVTEYRKMLDSATLSLDAFDLHINLSSIDEIVMFASENKVVGRVFLNEYGFIQFDDNRVDNKINYYDPMETVECAALEKDVTEFLNSTSGVSLKTVNGNEITAIPLVNSTAIRTALKHLADYVYREYNEELDFKYTLNHLEHIDLAYTIIDDDNDAEHELTVYADLTNFTLVTEIDGRHFKTDQYDSIDQMNRNVFDGLHFDDLIAFNTEEYERITKEYGENEPAAVPVPEVAELNAESAEVSSAEVPVITDENIIYEILKHDQFFNNTAADIHEFFSAEHSTEERITFLKETINDDFSQIFLGDGDNVYGYKTYDWGIVLWEGNYLTRTKEVDLPWGEVAEIYSFMVENGIISSDSEEIDSDIEDVYFSADDDVDEMEDNGEQQSFFVDLPAEKPKSKKGGRKSKKEETVQRNLKATAEISDEMIDFVLKCGSTERESLERITAYYQKNKNEYDNVEFLKAEYCGTMRKYVSYLPTKEIVSLNQIGRLKVTSRDSRGYFFPLSDGAYVQLTARFDENGITIGEGTRSEAIVSRHISWEEAAGRIEAMFMNGTFCAKEIIDRAEDNELTDISASLWYLNQDTDSEVYQYFIPEEMFKGGFPDSTERIKNALYNKDTLQEYIDGLEQFIADYAQNRDILRWHFHEPQVLLNRLKDIQIERRQFDSSLDNQPTYEHFVSEDEIDDIILDSHFGKKFSFAAYLPEEHTDKEKADYVKNYYGWGGGSTRGGWVSYESKGFSLTRGDYSHSKPECTKTISWKEYVSRVEKFIADDVYIRRDDHLERIRDCLWDIKDYIEEQNQYRNGTINYYDKEYENRRYKKNIDILNDYGIRTDVVLQRMTGKLISASASDLRAGDVIRYDDHIMEVEEVSESGITMRYCDADTFGGILQSSRLSLIHDEWVDEMNEKGIAFISRDQRDEALADEDAETLLPEKIDLTETENNQPGETEAVKITNTLVHRNYKALCKLYPDVMSGAHISEIYSAEGFDDLVIDRYGTQLIMSHNYVQNSDIMYDPRIDFKIDDEKQTVTAVSYEQSALGIYDEYTEGSVGQKDCNNFVQQWLKNLGNQPYRLSRVYLNYNDCDLAIDYDENGIIVKIDGDDEARAAYIKENNISFKEEKKIHQVITNAGSDGGIDDKMEYSSVEEAVKAGDDYLADGYLGYAVYNQETKLIEKIEGDFPAERAFSDEVLKINGITERYYGNIMLYKVGDFYEIYGEEARIASEKLGLYLTRKQGKEMCGFPDHAKNDYIDKLREAGYVVLVTDKDNDRTDGFKLSVGDVIYLPPQKMLDSRFKPVMTDEVYAEIVEANEENVRMRTYKDAELTEHNGQQTIFSDAAWSDRSRTWQDKLDNIGYRYVGDAELIRAQREQRDSSALKEVVFVCSANETSLAEIKDTVLSYGTTVTDGNKLTLFTSENYIEEVKKIIDLYGGGILFDNENNQIYPEIEEKTITADKVAVGDRFRHRVTGEISEVVSLTGALEWYTDQCTITTDKGSYATTENIGYDKLLNNDFYEYIGRIEQEQTITVTDNNKVTENKKTDIPTVKNLNQLKKAVKPGMVFEISEHGVRPQCVGELRYISSVNTVGFTSQRFGADGKPDGKDRHMEWGKASEWTFNGNEYTSHLEDGSVLMSFHFVDSPEPARIQENKAENEAAEDTVTVSYSDYSDTETTENQQMSMFDDQSPIEESVETNNSATWQKTQSKAQNYVFDPDNITERGARKRFAANYEAVTLLKKLEAENRNATADEQKILAKYVGWGGLKDAFDANNASWADEYAKLKELLTDSEYSAARSSMLTAYYSSPEIINGIYTALGNLGFKGGNVLEPSMGIGNFFAQYPADWKDNSQLYGIEIDDLTGRIAKQLYPEAAIQIKGFEKTAYSDNSFDVIIGNVPFGDFGVNDKRYNKLNLNIHDYFLAKSIDQVRPGGVIAVVTSTFTLDKKTEKFRNYLAARSELLGAVRLPKGTFADTDTATDILFLQKREGMTTIMPEWTKVGYNEDGFRLNEYFIKHPDMILGTIKKNTRYGEDSENIDIIADPTRGTLDEQIQEAVSKIRGRITESELARLSMQNGSDEEVIPADPNIPNQTYTIIDSGEVYFRNNEIMQKCKESGKRLERIKGMCKIRDIGMQLIRAEADGCDDREMLKLQSQLNSEYDRFVKKYGYLSDSANSVFSSDRYYNTICSFEVKEKEDDTVKYSKAAIFYRRTIQPEVEVLKVDTPQDALIVSIDKLCRVDIAYMSELTSMPAEEVISSLKGKIYRDPAKIKDDDPLSGYVEASEYLSGDVREKLRTAKLVAAIEPEFNDNVSVLESIQPQMLQPGEIVLQLGHPIVETDDYNQFIEEYANVNVDYKNTVTRTPLGEYKLVNRTFGTSEAETVIYGTKRMDCYEILVRQLNGRDLKVNDRIDLPDGSHKYVVNEAETRKAQEKGKQMEAAFKKWIWDDPERSDKYVKLYNDRYNCNVLRTYNGEGLSHPGMNPDIKLYPHQQNAVARAMYGNMLLAHDVGAGKTYTMGCIAADRVSRGLASRVLWLSPKSIIKQSADEVQKLYPNLKIYVLSDNLSTKKNRQRSVASILSSDAEVVFMTPETFGMIPMSDEYQIDYLNRNIDQYRKYLEQFDSRWSTSEEKISIKAIEAAIKKLEEQLEELTEKHRDNSYTFEDFGFNYLIVDEYHLYFKNMYQPTKMGNIPGLQNSPSKRAEDFRMKIGYMREQYGTGFMTLATATPETNSHLEWYNMMSVCDPEGLQKAGIMTADDWIKSYVVIESKYAPSPSGSGLVLRKQANSFNNVPELKMQIHEFADIVPTEKTNIIIPKRYSGKEIIVSCEQSEAQKAALESFMERAERIHSGGVSPDIDNMLLIMHESNLCSLDQRYLDPALPSDPNGKLETCARLVKEWYDKKNDSKGVQIVFLDRGVNEINGFSAYNALRDDLVAQGIPREEICMANDPKNDKEREAMYDDLRNGRKRVVIGSRQKLGTGVNIQNKVVAMYNIDLPFTPANKKQGEGRGLRQGNENSEVAVYTLVTKGSFDAYMANLLGNKETGQQQLLDPEIACSRSISDISESAMTFRDMQIATTDNPYLAEFLTLKDELVHLEALERDHNRLIIELERKIKHELPQQIENIESVIQKETDDLKRFEDSKPEKFEMMINGVKIDEREKCAAYMERTKAAAATADESVLVGYYSGFPVYISPSKVYSETMFTLRSAYEISVQGNFKYRTDYGTKTNDDQANIGNTTRLENIFANSLPKLLKQNNERLEKLNTDLRLAKETVEKPFDHAEELKTKRERMEFLTKQLTNDKKTSNLMDDTPEDDVFFAMEDASPADDPDTEVQKKPDTMMKTTSGRIKR
ncbi:Adenine-specific DNA methylase, N12 class [Ruminococcus sp. YE71]|uniref:YodL domain-containing protein n=1 Tax=unclassified Ruminococcus TaxID=2608920 RepID=UPI00088611F4|nr:MULTISPECIES: YodL domain-containing protein [unclassified Ruminococcus]SDA31045.1 Adenine-specific DNA methylase, N12 class [Ruminococcus sp. YE78]SFW50931.1 Adenine-specific DNA methylase, N12 class [Ruminococcus sp. YE71]